MSDTPVEDFEIRCEEAVLEMARGMDNVSEAAIADSEVVERGDKIDLGNWYWQGTLVLTTDMRGRVYRIPVYCDNEAGDVGIGNTDWDGGDTTADLYRQMWIHEVTDHDEQATNG